jgi:hypothetical protein
MHHPNIKTRNFEANQQATRVARGWEPSPKKFVPYLQTLQLLEREILPNCFLKEKNVNSRIPKEVSKLVSAPSAPKSLNVPNECSHLETRGEARAWQAGVFLRSLGARGEISDFLVTRFGLGIPGAHLPSGRIGLSDLTGHSMGGGAGASTALVDVVAVEVASAARMLSSSARLTANTCACARAAQSQQIEQAYLGPSMPAHR